MNKLSYVLLASTAMFSLSAVAGTEVTSTLEKFYINKSGTVLFKLNSVEPEECVDKNWPLGFKITDTSGKQWFDMLHQAKLQNRQIGIGFEENSPSRCSVSYIYYKD
ncbi:hypothetical protein [Thalassotalea montiporae]